MKNKNISDFSIIVVSLSLSFPPSQSFYADFVEGPFPFQQIRTVALLYEFKPANQNKGIRSRVNKKVFEVEPFMNLSNTSSPSPSPSQLTLSSASLWRSLSLSIDSIHVKATVHSPFGSTLIIMFQCQFCCFGGHVVPSGIRKPPCLSVR